VDYFGIGVSCGRLKLAWRFGHQAYNEMLIDGVKVADGLWHSLTVFR